MIGKSKKHEQLRKDDSQHKLPLLKSHELRIVIKKISSYGRIPSVQCFSNARFYSELNVLLSQGLGLIKNKHHATLMNRNNAAKNMDLQKRMMD